MVAKTKNNLIFVEQNLEIQSRHATTQQETYKRHQTIKNNRRKALRRYDIKPLNIELLNIEH